MIFRPPLAAQVLDGSKTMTRRPAAPGVPCRYVEGRDYAVQPGRGKPALGRVRVIAVRLELLGQITEADAQREGFANRDDFLAYWRELYGGLALLEHVYVLTLERLTA